VLELNRFTGLLNSSPLCCFSNRPGEKLEAPHYKVGNQTDPDEPRIVHKGRRRQTWQSFGGQPQPTQGAFD
jgi:hypothetical protein